MAAVLPTTSLPPPPSSCLSCSFFCLCSARTLRRLALTCSSPPPRGDGLRLALPLPWIPSATGCTDVTMATVVGVAVVGATDLTCLSACWSATSALEWLALMWMVPDPELTPWGSREKRAASPKHTQCSPTMQCLSSFFLEQRGGTASTHCEEVPVDEDSRTWWGRRYYDNLLHWPVWVNAVAVSVDG